MKKGKTLITIGLLLIAAALCLVVYNLFTTWQAGKNAEKLSAMLSEQIGDGVRDDLDEIEYPDYVLDPTMDMPVANIDGHDYVGIISIPKLNISLPVLNDWNYANLRISPCRYTGTAYMKNMVICAHNYQTHFGQIKTLAVGDSISFTDMDGNVFNYKVAGVEVLQPTAVDKVKNSEWDLTLFTCTIGGATRVTVRCELEK